jgi:hypothetical protein
MCPTIASWDEDIKLNMGPEPGPAVLCDWTDKLIPENIRKSLDGLINSAIEAYFITATRSDPAHRLSPHLFRIALARRLRLPVHTYRRKCKCKKWLDIFGDHYFETPYTTEFEMVFTMSCFAISPCIHPTWKPKKMYTTSPPT